MLKLIERSTSLSVTLEEMAAHLRRTDTEEEDLLIERCIKAAEMWAESFTGLALVDQTWEYYFDSFPTSTAVRGNQLQIPRAPLLDIEEFTYRDGTEQPFTGYYIDTASIPGRVYLPYGGNWPTTDGAPHAGRIRFRAGFVDEGNSPGLIGEVPEDIKAAVMIYGATLYENREQYVVGTSVARVPWSAEELLRRHRIVEYSMA